MKPVQIWIFLGVLVTGLLYGSPPLEAQPASKPVPTDIEPDPTEGERDPDDELDSTDDDAIVTDDDDKPWSQGVSAEDRKAARKLFLEGNRLFRIPLFAKAAEQYTAALSKWRHPAFYFNLALAQLNLGKEPEARENLERALQHGEEPLGAEQFQEAKKQFEEVKRLIGRLRVTCRTPGAEVTLNGVTLFMGPGNYEGWIKAKSHEITAKKAGYLSEARRVIVTPGDLQDVELRLLTLNEATDTGRRWAVWKPWAVVVAGGVIAGAGGGLHAFAFRNFNAYDLKFQRLPCADPPEGDLPGCPKSNPKSMKLNNLLSRAQLQQEMAIGAYIVGSSLLATGVVLLYMNRPRLEEQKYSSSATKHMVVEPLISRDNFSILINVNY